MGTILKHDPSFNIKLKKYDFIIGIDPGVNTGFAIFNVKNQNLFRLETLCPIAAMENVNYYRKYNILIRFEDARKRNWFGTKGKEALQGAGWAKAHSDLWERFCIHFHLHYEPVSPKDIAPWGDNKQLFEKITKYTKRSSKHSREAAALCFKYQ